MYANTGEPGRGGNRLLAALPPADFEEVQARLERIQFVVRQVLYEPQEPIHHVYFPTTAVISFLVVMEGGATTEVATVGNEGMVGLPAFLNGGVSAGRVEAQLPGEALRIEIQAFRALVQGSAALQALLRQYTHALLTHVSQNAACNRLHFNEARIARWLLMTQDRLGTDHLPITHELLSDILGVRRATISSVASEFQQAGLIRYHRGQLTILDRTGVEAAACECYGVIRERYEHLLGE